MAGNKLILVLGMHRSGTSLLASLLHRIGIHLGESFIPADSANPAGYWENIEVVAAHDKLLEDMGREWHTASAALPYPNNWWLSEAAQKARRELFSIASRELEKGDGTWAFKDPRTCRLLPLWRQVMDDIAQHAPVTPIYLLAKRRPTEVGASLARRDGLAPEMAELLWLWHYLEPLKFLGDKIDLVVSYDSWFEAPIEQTRNILRVLGVDESDEILERCRSILRPDLRNQIDKASSNLEIVQKLDKLLSDWHRDKSPPQDLEENISQFCSAIELTSAWESIITSDDPLRKVREKQIEVSVLERKVDSLSHDLNVYKDSYENVYRSYEESARSYQEYKVGYEKVYEAYQKSSHDFHVYRDAHDRLHESYQKLSDTCNQMESENNELKQKIKETNNRLDLIRQDILGLSLAIRKSYTWRLGNKITCSKSNPQTILGDGQDERSLLLSLIQLYESPAWELTGPIRAISKRKQH